MASRWREREATISSTWRQALLFNALLLILPILSARILIGAYTSNIATDPMSIEARTQTRLNIERAFEAIPSAGLDRRNLWADRIGARLDANDFPGARGYLTAAPHMLDRSDALAVIAAAEAEDTGSQDQRMARAAMLFLPDPVRAKLEANTVMGSVPTDPAASSEQTAEANDPLKRNMTLSVIGDSDDVTRRSQIWLTSNEVDGMRLRLRALGVLMGETESAANRAFAESASILLSAHRAGRLDRRFSEYLASRVEDALPEAQLRSRLATAFEDVLTTTERSERVMQAFQDSLQPDALDRLERDMVTIARLSDLTSSSGTLSLLELTSSPEDMRRILLVTEAGGDKAVALAHEIGPRTLSLAQIGVKWTRNLVLQVMALAAIFMALAWVTLSAFTQAETIRTKRR
ncbi:MAG: hypothetical protein AAGF20_04885 [Pseudomonadota bacterium]